MNSEYYIKTDTDTERTCILSGIRPVRKEDVNSDHRYITATHVVTFIEIDEKGYLKNRIEVGKNWTEEKREWYCSKIGETFTLIPEHKIL